MCGIWRSEWGIGITCRRLATTIENATIEQSAIGLNPPPRRRRSRIAWALWPACWAYTAVLVAIWIVLATLSDRWWLATVIMFGPRWIWGLPLVVLLPATLILCRRGLLPLSIAGIVLLVGVMRFCVPLPRFAAAGSGGVGLRMVTCNAHYRHLDSAALAAFIRDVKPDIVLVQACLSRRDPVILGEGWFWRRSGEMYIASRLPILEDSAPDDGAFQTGNGSAARFRLVGPQEVILPVALETDFYRRGHQASVKTPIPAYFSARRRTSFSGRNFRSSPTWRMSASRSASPAASGS